MQRSGKRCIIYGGGGFIGSHLADELTGRGYEVTVFDKLNFSKANLQHLSGNLRIIEGDFNNIVDIRNSLEGIDFVFHLVSSTLPASSNENPVYDAESNLISSLRLFRECCLNNVKKVIFLSSGGTVYGIPELLPVSESHSTRPVCSYGIIKKTIEDYLYLNYYLHSLDYTVFRLSNPYGERQNHLAAQGAVAVFLNKMLRGEEIQIWGNGDTVRDYIYIKDAVKALADSPEKKSLSRVFNLSSGEGCSLNKLVELLKNVTGVHDARVRYVEGRAVDVPVSILDNSLIRKEYGWTPETSLEDGLKSTCNYLRGEIVG